MVEVRDGLRALQVSEKGYLLGFDKLTFEGLFDK
jgi:hypothetical protein